MAAQRYPEDFDGIIAGALANRHIYMHTAGVARRIHLARNPDETISAELAGVVSDAVMNQCDTLGEGFLNNPRQCSFDFATLLCGNLASGGQCLTPARLRTVETYYGGLRNSAGELIFSGQALGNRMTAQQGMGENANVSDTVRIWGFQNPEYDWREFDLDRDMPIIDQAVGFVDSDDPDLRDFEAAGGKLLLYAGWGDTTITPENTVLYYESVLGEMGAGQDEWMRLFMVPGMGHCGGGAGPNSFDTLGTLDRWRSAGVAPDQMMGRNNQSGLARPLCPYPQYAAYDGAGDLADASNWACTAP
jgi:feruloyl esterase